MVNLTLVTEEGTPFKVCTGARGTRYAFCVGLKGIHQYVFSLASRPLNLKGVVFVFVCPGLPFNLQYVVEVGVPTSTFNFKVQDFLPAFGYDFADTTDQFDVGTYTLRVNLHGSERPPLSVKPMYHIFKFSQW